MRSNRGDRTEPSWIRSENDRWKARWGAWMLRSTIVAAVAHAVLFALWPVWEISWRAPEPMMEVVQIAPIPAVQAPPDDTGIGSVAALPTEEELSAALEEAGEGAEADAGQPEGQLGDELLLAAATSAFVPRISAAPQGTVSGSRPYGGLRLEQLEALSPQIARAGPPVSWPLIRNPTVITRFLRSRSIPFEEQPDAQGLVSVAMAINERGSVEWAEVHESSGHAEIDEIALSVFSRVAVFSPARSRGAPVPVTVVISIPFGRAW
jgi:TonB family protein